MRMETAPMCAIDEEPLYGVANERDEYTVVSFSSSKRKFRLTYNDDLTGRTCGYAASVGSVVLQ
jgi:hypothetical protein